MGAERTTYQPIGGIGEVEGSCLEDLTFVREHAGAQRSGEALNTTAAGRAREYDNFSLGDTLSRVVQAFSPVANNTASGVGVVLAGAVGGGVSSDTTVAGCEQAGSAGVALHNISRFKKTGEDGGGACSTASDTTVAGCELADGVAEPESAASGSKQYGGRGNGCAGGGAVVVDVADSEGADSEGATGVALHNISRFTKTEGGEGRACSTASDTTVAGREHAGAAGVALHNISRFTKTQRQPQSVEAWKLGKKACSESVSDEAGEWRPG